ncbi:MAG: hypothetical protein RL154_1304 [Pseudomonadota bacterium]|jgi:acyl-CoA hydrolase
MLQFNKHELMMSILMTPDKANFSGKVHGGEIMKMLDQAAYACAARYSGKYCVTISVDKILFKNPIPVGALVTFFASVNYTGRSSMEIGIKVVSEDIKAKCVTHTNSAYFSMVAVDENGKPTEIDMLVPQTEDEKRRFAAGETRKKQRIGK